MAGTALRGRIDPLWWAPVPIVVIAALVLVTGLLFSGSLRSTVPVTVVSDRTGLIMDDGAKVKMRGVQIGRVESVGSGSAADGALLPNLKLRIDSGPFRYLPSNVEAQIKASSAFGAKYVDLIVPPGGASPEPLRPGAVLRSSNVTVEVNTVFENLQSLVQSIDPAKLNAVLSALAEAFGGKGERIGQAITATNKVLLGVNPRMATVAEDWRLFGQTAEAYSFAAQNILTVPGPGRDLRCFSALLGGGRRGTGGQLLLRGVFPERHPGGVRRRDDAVDRTSPGYRLAGEGAAVRSVRRLDRLLQGTVRRRRTDVGGNCR